MTQEQKAKAYDEALKWMRELYPGLHGATKEDAEHYFPQLRESEDEKAKKIIASVFSEAGNRYIQKSERDIVLAYLEKQEQKPAECIEDSVKFEEGFKVGRESGLRDGQKYVLNNLDSYGLCKPAWSEEDEKIMQTMIKEGDLKPSEIAWLKSLRSGWKPTEEQMNALQNAVALTACDKELVRLYNQLKKL